MAVITISRNYGIYAEELLSNIAKELNYSIFSDEIIQTVAKKLNLELDEAKALYGIENFSTFKTFIHELLGSLKEGTMYVNAIPQIDAPELFPIAYNSLLNINEEDFTQKSYIDLMQSVIKDIASKNNVIIIGRAGQAILQDFEDVIHIRLESTLEKSIDRVVKTENLSKKEAENKILKINKKRAEYLKYYYNKDWYDLDLYNYVINIDKISKKYFQELIIFLLKNHN